MNLHDTARVLIDFRSGFCLVSEDFQGSPVRIDS